MAANQHNDRQTHTPDSDLRGARELSGRIALVTGAARRIGRSLVLALNSAGVRVIIHHNRSGADARQLAEQINTAAAEQEAAVAPAAATIEGDLADPVIASGLIARATEIFGPVDILINNASIFERGTLSETDCDQWDRHQAVNLRAPFLLSRAFADCLPAGHDGDIINLNDYRIARPDTGHLAYTISKIGLSGLTRGLACELAPNIRVNELGLGAILPPAVTGNTRQTATDYVHTRKESIPLRRFGDPADVAATMLYLLRSRNLTGQTVYLDGGSHLM